MASVDDLARRAVDAVSVLARRGGLVALRVAILVAPVAGLSYLTGLAATSGDAEQAWALIGGVLAIIAVGAPLLAWWRLAAVRRHATELVGEVRSLISKDAGAERVVIETVEVSQPARDSTGGATPAIVGQTVQFTRLRNLATSAGDLPTLTRALRAVTTFPGLLALALVLMLVFGVLGFIFLIAWIL